MKSFVDKHRQSKKKIRLEQRDFKAVQKYNRQLEEEKSQKRLMKVQAETNA